MIAHPSHADMTASALAVERLHTVFRKCQKRAAKITAESESELVHDLRKACKEMRYLMEVFKPLCDKTAYKNVLADFKELQDLLGEFQDGEVQAAALRQFAQEMVDAGRVDANAILAMGELSGKFEARQRAARETLTAHHENYLGSARRPSTSTDWSRRDLLGHGGAVVKVIASYNLKGGVGKTTAAVNLAYLSARQGRRTLLWDLDPQGAATYLFRVKPRVKGGSPKLVRGSRPMLEAIKATDFAHLDLLPADFTYRHMDIDLNDRPNPQRTLRRLLSRWPRSSTWSSWTPRRVCRWCRRTCCGPPTWCWCR